MAISIVLANKVRKKDVLSDEAVGAVVTAFVMAYLEAVEAYNNKEKEDDEHKVVITESNARGRLDNFLKKVEKKNTRKAMLEEWVLDGRFCTQEKPDKLKSVAEPGEMIKAVQEYADNTRVEEPQGIRPGYFSVRDVAWRLNAGTGSVGVPRFYVLIEGVDESLKTDSILDVKLQSTPTPYRFLDDDLQHEYRFFTDEVPGQDAIWHAAAYRAMAKGTDDHLGWLALSGDFYSVRERSYFKETLSIEKLNTKDRFISLAEQWGELLAAVHARSLTDFNDDTKNPDLREKLFFQQKEKKSFKSRVSKRTEGKFAEFCSVVNEIAFSYAAKVTEDYDTFVEALESQS
jgi:hypothetical protein